MAWRKFIISLKKFIETFALIIKTVQICSDGVQFVPSVVIIILFEGMNVTMNTATVKDTAMTLSENKENSTTKWSAASMRADLSPLTLVGYWELLHGPFAK